MKIAILPSTSDTVNHILHCINLALLTKGHNVFFPQITIENKQKKLATKDFMEIVNNKPDFVIFVGMAGIIRDQRLDQYDHLLEANKIPYIMLFYDFPINLPTLAKTKLNHLKHIFTWDRAHIEYFEEYKIHNVSYLPLATSPGYFAPKGSRGKKYETSFIGGLSSKEKIKELYLRIPASSQKAADNVLNRIIKEQDTKAFLNETTSSEEFRDFYLYIDHRYDTYKRKTIVSRLAGRFEVHIFGNEEWKALSNINFHKSVNYRNIVADVYSSSKININISSAHLTTSLNQRIFDCYGSNNFMISDYREDIDNLFTNQGYEIPVYKNNSDLLALTEHYLTNKKERESITKEIHHYIINNHTWDKRVDELLELIK